LRGRDMGDGIIIGIAGGTGSGKTTLISRIEEEFKDQVTIVCHDYYYRRNSEMPFSEREKQNYDHPNSFETDLMISHIEDLRQGKTIYRPVYDFVQHDRKDETVKVKPSKVIIVEGILIFENRELLDLFDIKVFVDTDADVRIIRRILRDVKERGRSLESVIAQYLTTVKLMHEQFVEPSKKYADIIIPEGGYNKVAIQMLNERIKALLL
jgi:uridine kinase